MFRFSIETSSTPIYRRIINCMASSLAAKGHQVTIEQEDEYNTIEQYIQSLAQKNYDFIIITNPNSAVSAYISTLDAFAFELLPQHLIFLHHDNCIARPGYSQEMLIRLYSAFRKTSERSHHFCIESSNCEDLRQLGVVNTYHILHASEFNHRPLAYATEFDTSFVGHALGAPLQFDDPTTSHQIQRDYWSRICDLSYSIGISDQAMIKHHDKWKDIANVISQKGLHVATMHNYSLLMRGEILMRTNNKPINIFGGDPAYLHGINISRRIASPNLTYHPPTKYAEEAAQVYNKSLVNINITPFQFNTCVINRVIDIGAAGGFPLTDWKDDLATLTSVHKEISYKSIEELREKILYYCQAEHQKERLEICETLCNEMQANFNYSHVVDYLISKISQSPHTDTLTRIDLGCGSHKVTGYIGVDVAPSPSVDIVADLTRRFPFGSSSVDHLRAHDIIEHLPDRIHTMNEIWRICKPDALVDIRVPSSDGRGAFQDPTHVSFWNVNSFLYYSRQYPSYFNLCRTYGFNGEFEVIDINEETSEDRVIHVNVVLKVVKSIEKSPTSETASANLPETNGSDSNALSLGSELRDINILVNIQKTDKPVNAEEYAQLKALATVLINDCNSGKICLLVGSKSHGADEISNILFQLMLDLLAADQVPFAQDPPNLIPAPTSQSRLDQLRPYLACELPLAEIDIGAIQAITAQVQHLDR